MKSPLSVLRPFLLLGCLAMLVAGWAPSAHGQVVINEIMPHPPRDRDGLQYVELLNSGATPADLSGWSFSKGIKFTFTKGTRLPPHGFLVVCRRKSDFLERYGSDVPLAGQFEGQLSHGGERIELSDAMGRVVDAVRYSDRAPWPLAADGASASLERICPKAPGADPANWAPSKLPRVVAPAGTPGRTNESYSANLPPTVSDVTRSIDSPAPGQAVTITARVTDADSVASAVLLWRVVVNGASEAEQRLPMQPGTDKAQDTYAATIPGQAEGRLVRYRIAAQDKAGTERMAPSTNDVRPAWSFATFVNTNQARVPLAFLLRGGGGGSHEVAGRRGTLFGAMNLAPARSEDALVFLPSEGGKAQLFDFVEVASRTGGQKIRFLNDEPLAGMSIVNVIFESPRAALSEVLAFDLYERAGVPAPRAEHWRVWVNGRPLGYQLAFEQVNKSFLTRHGRDDSGHLYKLIWYGSGVVGQHEKKTDLEGDHSDLLATLEGLSATNGPAQWEFIEKQFNVTNFINYFAVNMCLQNWDGFFNNYFTYHDTGGSGRWEIYPWDEDKTWGDYDGRPPSQPWYTMPLTFGMNGDQPPGTRARPGAPSPRFRGGMMWWRGPGWFSGPLLANPEFRKRFLVRLRELCQTQFTEAALFPTIGALEKRLEPEMKSAEDQAEFRRNIQSYRDQVVNRRRFLLTEVEKELAELSPK